MSDFEKYRRNGAYHWRQVDRRWGNPEFNPPLLARYQGLAQLASASATKVLDVGCGDGYLLYRVSQRCPQAKLFGIDGDEVGIQLAAAQLQQHQCPASLQQASAYQLPFEAGEFDLVLSADVIEHLDDPELAVQEMHRILQPGGVLLISTPNRQPDRQWDPLHIREYNPDELTDLLRPYFSRIKMRGCWAMGWMRSWLAGGRTRQVIDSLCRLGYNPFLQMTDTPSPNEGQLMAWCQKYPASKTD
ncbi:class I SAM-dependent methyltransferase [Neosynechococcus sphagnicola]|uniref:class I SAM-dependent methyltransferase n=1 Tax=Neosynechococcus sphagnicola TaxID=1501145 RepID=UPI00069194D9|nr:class I SAM-dependent methyltransferase [Neosynechococcus sphagnicola]